MVKISGMKTKSSRTARAIKTTLRAYKIREYKDEIIELSSSSKKTKGRVVDKAMFMGIATLNAP